MTVHLLEQSKGSADTIVLLTTIPIFLLKQKSLIKMKLATAERASNSAVVSKSCKTPI